MVNAARRVEGEPTAGGSGDGQPPLPPSEEQPMSESTVEFASVSDWWNSASEYSLEEVLLEIQHRNEAVIS